MYNTKSEEVKWPSCNLKQEVVIRINYMLYFDVSTNCVENSTSKLFKAVFSMQFSQTYIKISTFTFEELSGGTDIQTAR